MALSQTNAFSGPYTANGVTVAFPFSLPVVASTDITVVAIAVDGTRSTVSPSLYTITRAGESGTVTFGTAPASGQILVTLDPDFEQDTSFTIGASFYAPAVNNALDKGASRDIYLKGELDRALKVDKGAAAPELSMAGLTDGDLLEYRDRRLQRKDMSAAAGLFAAFDSNADLVGVAGAMPDGVPALASYITVDGGGTVQGALNGYTRASAIGANIPPIVQRLATIGYAAPYDGGHAWYKRVASEPSHNGKFQDAGGQWWALDEAQPYVEQFGGGVVGAVDTGLAINQLITYYPDRTTASPIDASPYVKWNTAIVQFRHGGRFTHATRIVIPGTKGAIFWHPVAGAVTLKYTGADDVGIRFDPRGIACAIGMDNFNVEGGDVAVVGGANGAIIFKNCNFSHMKNNGHWFTDAFTYYDSDNPAVEIASFTAANPCRITTATAHGLTSGARIGIRDALGEERINGLYYVTVINSTTVDLYTNAGRTTGLNATTFTPANLVGGLLCPGFKSAPLYSSGIQTVWVDLHNMQYDTCIGHQLNIEASTYLLFYGDTLRFRTAGKTPLVIDANGVNLRNLEFFGVDTAAYDDEAHIHVRCRINACGSVRFDTIRHGPEDATFAIGGDYTSTNYAPPKRYIIIGPSDGSTARNSVSTMTISNVDWFGENVASPDTLVMIDVNAAARNLVLDGAHEVRNMPSGSVFIKETHTEAGRSGVTDSNIIGANVLFTTSALCDTFSFGGIGWDNLAKGNGHIRGEPTSTMTITTGAAVGSGTVTAPAGDNTSLFTLSITPAGSPSGTTVCTLALPKKFTKNIKPVVTPVNAAARALGVWGYASASTTGCTIQAPSALTAGTAYTVDVEIRGCF